MGLDPVPSATVPALGPALALSFRSILEPPAIALDNALALQKAEALSVTDDLTRLYNSRYLNLVLRRESKRASRSGRPLSLLFIDLDGFKQINDTHGHLAGSKALVEASVIVRGSARETDVADQNRISTRQKIDNRYVGYQLTLQTAHMDADMKLLTELCAGGGLVVLA